MNDLYLSDEEIYGKEPTWEEQEIERLKEEKEQIEDKLEISENKRKMAREFIQTHYVSSDIIADSFGMDNKECDEVLEILSDEE